MLIILIGFLLFFCLSIGFQIWSELDWRLKKYGTTARVPKWMKYQYLRQIKKQRKIDVNNRKLIMQELLMRISTKK